jgi:hypothetical protein
MPVCESGKEEISIYNLVRKAEGGEYDIPEFQRDFVWTKDRVKDFLDSLIKGYPVGSLLIWSFEGCKSEGYKSGKHVSSGISKENWVVDGQQRIVSLCLIMSRKPNWMNSDEWNKLFGSYKIKINVLDLTIALEHPGIKKDPKWVYPYEIFSKKEDELREFAEELSRKINESEKNITYTDLYSRVYSRISQIWNLQHTIKIPVVKINAPLEDVAIIFERINSKGTRVKQSDVTLAYIAAYNVGWVREKFMKCLKALDKRGFYLDPTVVIRTITTIGENKAVLRNVSDKFLGNREALDKALSSFEHIMWDLIENHLKRVGILSSRLIYAKNTIIPLIYLYHKFPNQYDFNKAFHFFLLALGGERYSGSAETTLQEDVNIISGADSFERAIEELHKKLDPIEISKDAVRNSVHYQGEGRFLKLLLYLVVYKKEARDWFSGERLGYLGRDVLSKDFTIEIHHFFPKSILRKYGYSKDEQEALANIAFINPGTNKRLRDEPYIYIKRCEIKEEELSKQLIPIDEKLWKVDHYKEFLDKRSEIIADELTRYMRSLYPEFYS